MEEASKQLDVDHDMNTVSDEVNGDQIEAKELCSDREQSRAGDEEEVASELVRLAGCVV